MDTKAYLHRIHYSGPATPNWAVLKQLQRCHLLAVPFENLDIHYSKPITLQVDQLFHKIVEQRRGGFCYELNGLFYELLTALGFEAQRISARVYNSDKGYGPEFDHLAIVVTLEEVEYLVDVGFGEFAFGPLTLQLGVVQQDERGAYCIDKLEHNTLVVSKVVNDTLTPEYCFQNTARALTDFEAMCDHHQTSPESHFTSKRLISLPTETGRKTITGNRLKLVDSGSTIETVLQSEAAFHEQLSKLFYTTISSPPFRS